jgi:hypothetical protein
MGTYIPTPEELSKLILIFKNIKAETDKVLQEHLVDLFVTTDEYFEAQRAGKAIILGRKGSGKTALLLGFSHYHSESYQVISKIDADEIPITGLYNYYLADHLKRSAELYKLAKGIASESELTDLATFINPVRLSTYAWQKAFQDYGLYLACQTAIEYPDCSQTDKDILVQVIKAIKGKFDDSDASAFLYALLTENYDEILELIEGTINTFVGNAWGKLISLITNKLISKFRANPPNNYSEAINIIKERYFKNNWRILINFDRFDDFYDKHYQEIRHSKEQDGSRRQILSAVLEGLVLAASAIKNHNDYEWLDLLVTIPMDKFMELSLRERARIEFENTIPLQWNPPELFDYANRRIANALGWRIPAGKNPWYYIFPDNITNVAANNIKEDSFLYMVRHTQWKPREIQMYISRLIVRMFSGGINYQAREAVFREAIQEQSREIIRQEFEPEFKRQYPRLWRLLKQLQASKIFTVMPLSDFMDVISGARLSDDVADKTEVLRRLYHMGIVGVRKLVPTKQRDIEPTITQNKQEVSYTFFFSSKDHDPFAPNVDICFHPLFFDEIGAVHNEDYIVNELKWDMFRTDANHLRYKPR